MWTIPTTSMLNTSNHHHLCPNKWLYSIHKAHNKNMLTEAVDTSVNITSLKRSNHFTNRVTESPLRPLHNIGPYDITKSKYIYRINGGCLRKSGKAA
jgi:hypothetical protein